MAAPGNPVLKAVLQPGQDWQVAADGCAPSIAANARGQGLIERRLQADGDRRPLIVLDAEHYAREAEFRFALVRANEEIEGITLNAGEADEKSQLDAAFETVVDVSRRIVGG